MKILYNEMVVYYSCILRLRTIKKRKEYATSGFIWDIFEQNIPDYIFLCYFLIRQIFLFLLYPPPLFQLSLILSFPFLHAASSVIEQPSFFPSPIVAFLPPVVLLLVYPVRNGHCRETSTRKTTLEVETRDIPR